MPNKDFNLEDYYMYYDVPLASPGPINTAPPPAPAPVAPAPAPAPVYANQGTGGGGVAATSPPPYIPTTGTLTTGTNTYGVMNDGQTVMQLYSDGVWRIVTDPTDAARVLAYSGGNPGTVEVPDTYTKAGGIRPPMPTTPPPRGMMWYWDGTRWITLETGNTLPLEGGNTPRLGGTGYEMYSPFTQYLQQLGLGRGYQNMAQTYLANLFRPLRSVFEMMQAVNVGQNQPSEDWSPYVSQFAGNIGDVKNRASNVLSSLFGMDPGARTTWGLGFEPEYDPLTGGKLDTGGMGMGNLQDILRYGLANQYGGIGSTWAASRLPYMQQQWELGQAGGEAGTFLDYLRQKLGM